MGYISAENEQPDTQNDAIFEAGDTSFKSAMFGIYIGFRGFTNQKKKCASALLNDLDTLFRISPKCCAF